VCVTWGIELALFLRSKHGKSTNQNEGHKVMLKIITTSSANTCVFENKENTCRENAKERRAVFE